MNKPNESQTSVLARFTEARNHLKQALQVLDSIGTEPYIPSIRLNAFAHITDKIENIQSNLHSLHMQLAYLDTCSPGSRVDKQICTDGHRCKDFCPGCGCQHFPMADGPGCQVCMEIGAR